MGPLGEGTIGLLVDEGARIHVPMTGPPTDRQRTEPEGEIGDHALFDRAAPVQPRHHRRWRQPGERVGGAVEAAHHVEGRGDLEGTIEHGHERMSGVGGGAEKGPCVRSKV